MRIEPPVPFASSRLWALQRDYFVSRGIDAWRSGDVPHYVASNPTVAQAFADLILALALDRRRLSGDADDGQPLHICELGAGSGRFAFHLLTRLGVLCARAGLPLSAFRYVMTDIVPANRAFWRGHPNFQSYFETGVLETAAFDVTAPESLRLEGSGALIEAGSCQAPLIVISNYLFDSIPQDLFAIEAGDCHPCHVALDLDDGEVGSVDPSDPADLLAHLALTYQREAVEAAYPEPWLQAILDRHRREITRSHVLLPAAALRCLEHLRGLSQQGLMLLSVDMGQHDAEALDRRDPPSLNRHGCVSLAVNYYALRLWCEHAGGLAFFPSHPHRSIATACCLLVEAPEAYRETRAAFARSIDEVGPDAFFSISRHARRNIAEMSLDDILAYLRLSHFDAHLFAAWLPRLQALAADFDAPESATLVDAVRRVWDCYYPIGEDFDLAEATATLLYALDAYEPALLLFMISAAIYGDHTGKLFNRAACLAGLGRAAEAADLLEQVLAHDPDNKAAAALRQDLAAAEEAL